MAEPVNLSTPLAYALAYAAMGWHVLPLEPGAKAPLGRLVPRGMHDATTDAEVIRGWWQRNPQAGVGIALAQSGLVAVDVDPRNGGTDTFEQLQAAHGSLRSDVMAFTGGGGEHHVFLVPHGAAISLPGTLGAGIDLKANGYIVVEPSVHPSGKQYGWEASSSPLDGVVPSPLPDWLRSLRVELQQPTVRVGEVPVDPVKARDAREALYLLNADEHDQWVKAGMALHSTRWGHPAYAMWCAWAQQSSKFDSTDQRKRWESFHTDDQRNVPGITLAWVFAEAQRAGWLNPAARVGAVALAPAPAAGLPLVFAEDITADCIRIDQLVEDVLTAGGLSVMYGESNSGKSFLACDMACSIGAELTWLGKRTVKGAVLYVAGEGSESIKLRVLAWQQHRGVVPALAVVPVSVNLLDPRADVQRIADACHAVQARCGLSVSLIVIDTLARAFGGGNENASEDMGAVIAHADMVRVQTGAHVMFVHHSGKDAAKGSRGHSSLKAATDTEIEVTGEQETHLHTATITKQRDLGSRGEQIVAKFHVIKMGEGQWGKPITTCLVEPTDARAALPASKRGKGDALQAALIVTLASATNRTMKRAELLDSMLQQGFTKSPVYRALQQLAQQQVITEVLGRVHLNGQGKADSGAAAHTSEG
jgi:hypothetical protein